MHTEGPWVVANKGVRSREGYICFMREVTHWPDQVERYTRETEENDANARLIAAAPDLLTLLNDALASFKSTQQPGHYSEGHWSTRVEALITSIEGEKK